MTLDALGAEVARKHSQALHEIRKLNRVVKHEAERLCRDESPHDLDRANTRIVRIWKTAEIMSTQFEVLEFLANQDLAQLPRQSPISVYKIFDKIVRVYGVPPDGARLSIRGNGPEAERLVLACDKTFPIIPTVLIENALRYSIKGTPIEVVVNRGLETCEVTVTNRAPVNRNLDRSVFDPGVRATEAQDGSGFGLHVAQLVARQHGTEIQLETRHTPSFTECIFRITFEWMPLKR